MRNSLILKKRNAFAFALAIWFISATALASSGITYQGRILKPDGSPLTGANVQFKIQIRTPDANNCLMYEEMQSMDMRNSNGVFALTLNDGTGSRTDSTGLNLDRVFSNAQGTANVFNFNPTTCNAGSSYSPSTSDGRSFVVSFKDETMAAFEPMPAQKINFIPMAFEAKQIAGFTPASLVRVAESDGTLDTVSPLSNANYTELLNLIGGTSSQYAKQSAAAGTVVSTVGGTGNVATPSAGSVWLDTTGGNLKFYDGATVKTVGTAGGSVTSVATGTGLTGGPITTTGTISLATLGTGGTGFKVTYDTYGRVTGAVALVEADIPNLTTAGHVSGSAITSGTIAGNTSINTTGTISSGAITSSGLITSPSLSSTAIGTQSVQIFETTNNFKVSIVAPASLGANYTLTLPTTAGSSNQVLTTNGAGVLTWTTPAGTGISALTSDVSASGTGSVAATVNSVGGSSAANVHTAELAANAATNLNTVSTIVKRDGSGNFAASAVTHTSSIFKDTGANTVTVQAPTTVTTSYVLKLPPAVAASAGQYLSSDTSGNLSWSTLPSSMAPSGAAGGDLSGTYPNPTVATVGTSTAANVHAAELAANAATALNTNSKIVARDGSGNFAANVATVNGIALNNAGSILNITNPVGGAWNMTLPATAGSNNQVMVTNGSGIMSWATPVLASTGFVNGGNAFGANASVGTNDAFRLDVKTNNLARMTVDSSGNVGIGTTAPATKLELAGTLKIGDGGETCGATYAGGVRYNGGNIQFCNGTSWSTLGVAGAGITALTGDVTASGSGSVASTVAQVGGVSAANVATGANLANAATNLNTASTIVKRDASGNFTAGTITSTAMTSGAVTETSTIYKDTGANTVTVQAPTTVSTSYVLKLPTAVAASAGQVLASDTSGNMSWSSLPTALPPNGAAGGDLTGTYPNPTIASSAVTYAKMQNVSANNKLLGRATAGAGVVEEITLGTGLSLAGTTLNSSSLSAVTNTATLTNGKIWIGDATNKAQEFALSGDATVTAGGAVTVASVGTSTSANIHSAELAANGATAVNTNSKIVLRDGSGNFASNVATLNGIALNNAGSILNITNPVGGAWNMNLPATAGSNGQTMITNGSGVMSWATPVLASTGFINGGNSFGANASIGTNDAFRLDVKTNNAVAMTVDSAGKVGIGTTAPTNILTVVGGDAKINGLTVGLGLGAGATNTAMGAAVLASNTTGSNNTAVGNSSLNHNTTGTNNTGVGQLSLNNTTTGFFNTAVGVQSLSSNTSGYHNTAVGMSALNNNTAANNNSAYGDSALATNSIGAANTAVGVQAGYDVTTGSQNTFLGYFPTTGVGVTTGSNNIMVGYDVRPPSQTSSNQLNIGNLLYATGLSSGATLSTGNVGIGTTAPATKLEVSGTLKVGDGGETCGATYAGGVRYNGGNIQFCNGTSWSTLGVAGAGITALTGDVTASGTGSVAATVANVGGVTAANVAAGANLANAATNLNTASTIVKRDGSGNFAASAITETSSVFKDTGANTVTVSAPTTVSTSYALKLPAAVAASAGQVLASDTSGNMSWSSLPTALPPNGAAGGDLSGTYPNPTVATVGLSSAANIHSAELAANAATNSNSLSTIVKRDGSGNFASNVVTANGFTLNNAGSLLNIVNPVGGAWNMTLPATAGSNGQVMQTNGSGVMTWTTPLTSTTGFINGGNSFGANASIGTNDAFRLDVKTNNVARMTVDSAGLVGIGTTSPNDSLVVVGAANGSGGGHVIVKNTTDASSASSEFHAIAANGVDMLIGVAAPLYTQVAAVPGNAGYIRSNSSAGLSLVTEHASGEMRFSTGGNALANERMRITAAGGIGIGTTAPSAGRLLDVNGWMRATRMEVSGGDLEFWGGPGGTYASTSSTASQPSNFSDISSTNNNGGTGSGAFFRVDNRNSSNTDQQAYWGAISNASGYTPAVVFGQQTGATAYAERMRIDTSGNVGIGTTAPATKLDVAGTLRIGDGGETCGASFTGAIRYNTGAIQYCNGTAWTAMSGGGGGITALTGDVTASGPGSVAGTVAQVGGVTAANVAAGANLANAATNLNSASTIVKRDASGNFAAGAITHTSSVFKDSGANTVTVSAPTTVSTSYALKLPAAVAASAGQVLASDTSGNMSWSSLPTSLPPSGSAGGDLSGTYPNPTIATVGTSTAANVHAAELLANAATNANTNSAIVKRDASGNFASNVITGNGFTLNNAGSLLNIVSPAAGAWTMTLPATAGTNGQVMATNGSGTLNWVTPASSANAFMNGGNSFAATAVLGTNDANRLDVKTNNAVRMTVDSSGNVGIGTTAPTHRLEVPWLSGDAVATSVFGSTNASNNQIAISATSNTNDAIYGYMAGAGGVNGAGVFGETNNSGSGVYGLADLGPANGVYGEADGTGVGVYGLNASSGIGVKGIGTSGAGGYFSSSSGYALITGTGNVGIGTTAPQYKFDLWGAPRVSGDSMWGRFAASDKTRMLQIGDKSDTGVGHHPYIQSYSGDANAETGRATHDMWLNPEGGTVVAGVMPGGWYGLSGGLDVRGANQPLDSLGNLAVIANGTQAADIGGVIALVGPYKTWINVMDFATIAGKKENGTDSDASGYFAVTTTDSVGNGTEKLRVTSTGKVGIGTSAPDSALSVKSPGQNAVVNIYGVTSTTDYGVVQVSSSGALTNASNRPLALQPNNGSVGIGTTAPRAKLELSAGTGGGNGAEGDYTKAQLQITDGVTGGLAKTLAIGFDTWDNNGVIQPMKTSTTPTNLLLNPQGGNVGIGTTAPTYQLQLSTDSAAKPGTSTWTIASDERLKDIRAPFTRGLKDLDGLNTIYFKYKKDNPLLLPSDKEYVGIRAQEALKVIPEAVSEDEKGYYHVTNDSIIWTAVNAIKELYHKVLGITEHQAVQDRQIASIDAAKADKSEIATLKKDNEALRSENAEMKKRLERIEKMLDSK